MRGCPNRVKVKQSYCLREITKKPYNFFLYSCGFQSLSSIFYLNTSQYLTIHKLYFGLFRLLFKLGENPQKSMIINSGQSLVGPQLRQSKTTNV